MKRLLLLFISPILFGQITNKIEGIIMDIPCELEYTRNLGNQNNYNCVYQDNKNLIYNYSVTVQNLFKEMNGLDNKSLESFKKSFFQTAEEMSKSNGESTKNIILADGLKALETEFEISHMNETFRNTSVIFLYKQKSFIVNFTSNNLSTKSDLINEIKFQ